VNTQRPAGSNAAYALSRDPSVETLRGLACLLLVAFHVIGMADTGMQVSSTSIWRHFTDLMTPVRMPLFAFISGFVLVITSRSTAGLGSALAQKFRRLGVPLLVASSIYNLIYGITDMPQFVGSPFDLYLKPFMHLWYLQSALTLVVLVTLTVYLLQTTLRAIAPALFAIALLLNQWAPALSSDIFSFAGTIYLLPFFSLGILVRQWAPNVRMGGAHPLQVGLLASALMFGLVLVNFSGLFQADDDRYGIAAISVSCGVCLTLYAMRMRLSPLATLGGFSYAIFLYHPLFSSMSRHLMAVISPNAAPSMVFMIGMVAGLGLPALLQRIVQMFPVLALLLFGLSTKNQRAIQSSAAGQRANNLRPKEA
jgi:peptidoglycan/LPS O-acetylase OafA/YrhL